MSSHLTLPVDPNRDHLRGPASAPAMLVEYGDYECPHCGAAHVVLTQLEQTLGDSLVLVFRNFPLATAHPHAALAAEAAEAAGDQGQFWPMHDALFENQDALSEGLILRLARNLGLDLHRFERDLQENRFAARVREDFMSGVRSGVNGTPTFFLNGLRYDGPPDFDSLRAAIERSIDSSRLHQHGSRRAD